MSEFDVKKISYFDKIKLTHGKGAWHTNSYEGLPSVTMADGPHGLRKQSDKNKGINDSERATCFPAACAVASSFNRKAAAKVASCIAEEAVAQGVDLVLGPGINIKRSPLCGRNFEYFSEDPLLSGEMSASYVNAMQAHNVGSCVKHFAVNSQETRRMTVDAIVDERALREIYLAAFENVVTNAHPYAVMASYNKLHGTPATQNAYLYRRLRGDWGFDGLVMSDWGAAYNLSGAYAEGMDLEMPDGGYLHELLTLKGLRYAEFDEAALDRACQNLYNLAEKCQRKKVAPPADYLARHDAVAREVARESAVLLRNEDDILPLSKRSNILVVGELAEKPRFQGAGSSHVNAVCRNFLDILTDNGINFHYEKGYSVKGDTPNVKLEEKAVEDSAQYDAILFFGGLTDDFEGEGYDRTTLDIPACQRRLLHRLYTVNKDIVFVGFGGAPYAVPWICKTKALLNMYLGGQAVMYAAYDLIFGDECPSGRLAETFPIALKDTPCYNYFANDRFVDEHRESIFVGYRYYNTFGIIPRYPFGYGLSYTKFAYSDLKVSKTDDGYDVEVNVANVGKRDAYEVVQVYVDNCECGIMRAKRELAAFDKVFVKAGETARVKLTVPNKAFRVFYDKKFRIVAGGYKISVCRNVERVLLSADVRVEGETIEANERELYPSYFQNVSDGFTVDEEQFYRLVGYKKRAYAVPERGKFTLRSTLEDMQCVPIVRMLKRIIKRKAKKMSPSRSMSDPVAQMIYRGAMETPLISMTSVGGIPAKYVMFLYYNANKRHGKALSALFRKVTLYELVNE